MRLTNTLETYGLVHQLLHWAVALGILTMIPLGLYMHDLPVTTEAEIADKVWLYSLHKTIGVSVLAFAIVRIGWALTQPHPRLRTEGAEAFAAKAVHWLLYGSIILVPLTGWIHHAALAGYADIWWPFPQTLPFVPKDASVSAFFGTAHDVLTKVLAVSLLLHIAGALKHAVIDRDETLQRMVPGAYDETGRAPPAKPFAGTALAAALGVFALASAVTVGLYAWDRPAEAATVLEEAAASEGAWTIDRERSRLVITVQQLGSPVEGTFTDWTADVVFDPDAPENATIEAQVALGSLQLSDVSERALSDEFLNAQANPNAIFRSTDVTRTDDGYVANGTLTLSGVEQPFALPFTFAETDGRATVTANAPIPRLDFGVGVGMVDGSSVGLDVQVMIEIEATR